MSPTREFQTRIQAEIAKWPGVEARFTRRRKHPAVILRYGEVERSTVYPGTPSDCRSLRNQIGDLRRLLTSMGASR